MGACASRFEVLKEGPNPLPPAPMVPPPGDESCNRLSFDHLLQEKNDGEKVASEREREASQLVKSDQDQVEGNCQENGSLKSLQPADDPLLKTEVEKTPITEGLTCKTSEEMNTNGARGDKQSGESEAIPRNVEQKQVEITGKDLNPLKTENLSTQERI